MVELTNENSLLQRIREFATNRKIRNSVKLTASGEGSRLTAAEVKPEIEKLIPTTRQRINAAKFHLDAMENMNCAPYLGSQHSLPAEQKSLIEFSSSDVQVQINLLNSSSLTLVIFILLNGFFSNLVSLEDCVAKIINIIYDLTSHDRPSSVRQALKKKIPSGNLTMHLCTFHAIGQDGKLDKTGSIFNIAREIRNQLTHGDITEIVLFPRLSLSGVSSDLDLYFSNSYFPPNTPPEHRNTEMIAFCQNAYDETVNFVDECYRLICDDLQHSEVLPI